MHGTILIAPLLFGGALCFPSTLGLEIFANVNGSEAPAPPVLEVSVGQRFTLICRIVDARNRLGHNAVFWEKQRSLEVVQSREVFRGTNFLNFTSVAMEDEGIYICVDYGREHSAKIRIRVGVKSLDGRLQLTAEYSNQRKRLDDHGKMSVILGKQTHKTNGIMTSFNASNLLLSHRYLTKTQLGIGEYYYSSYDHTYKKTTTPIRTPEPLFLKKLIFVTVGSIGCCVFYMLLMIIENMCLDAEQHSTLRSNDDCIIYNCDTGGVIGCDAGGGGADGCGGDAGGGCDC